MKKFFVALALACQLNASGIPAVDVANLSQAIMDYVSKAVHYANTAQQWIKEVNHFRDQIQNYKQQFVQATQIGDAFMAVISIKSAWDDIFAEVNGLADFFKDLGKDPAGAVKQLIQSAFPEYDKFNDCFEKYPKKEDVRYQNLCLKSFALDLKEMDVKAKYMQNMNSTTQDMKNAEKAVQEKQGGTAERIATTNKINYMNNMFKGYESRLNIEMNDIQRQRWEIEKEYTQLWNEKQKKKQNYCEILKVKCD